MTRFVERILLAAILSAGVASAATADLLLYEGFDYEPTSPPTLLSGMTHPSGNQWLRPANPPGEYSVVSAGNLNFPGLPTASGNSALVPRATPTTGQNRLTIPGQPYARVDGGSYFFSFTMQMTTFVNFAPEIGDAGAKNETGRRGGFVAGFFGAPASTTTSMSLGQSFAAPVYVRREVDYSLIGSDGTPGVQTGRYQVGVQKRATAIGLFDSALQNSRGVVYDETASFAVGETVLIVGEYKFVDTDPNLTGDIARLWINPTPGDFAAAETPTIADDTLDSPNMQGQLPIASFHLRNDTHTPGNVLIDELRIGTSFAAVLPGAPAGLVGDFNGDLTVDGADFLAWQRGESLNPLSSTDLQDWQSNYGATGSNVAAFAVPEPAALPLAAGAGLSLVWRFRPRKQDAAARRPNSRNRQSA
jgi:hypothetical protein